MRVWHLSSCAQLHRIFIIYHFYESNLTAMRYGIFECLHLEYLIQLSLILVLCSRGFIMHTPDMLLRTTYARHNI